VPPAQWISPEILIEYGAPLVKNGFLLIKYVFLPAKAGSILMKYGFLLIIYGRAPKEILSGSNEKRVLSNQIPPSPSGIPRQVGSLKEFEA
jgi:hypothetical protein